MSEQQRARRRRQRQRRRQRRRDEAPELDAQDSGDEQDDDSAAEPEPSESESRKGERVLGDPPARPRTIFGMPRIVFAMSVGIFAALLIVIVLGEVISVSDDIEGVDRSPDQGRRHLAAGELFDDYNSNPPTSGPHEAVGVPAGVYGPDEPTPFDFTPTAPQLLSVLEAGGIVIHYHPDLLPEPDLELLRANVRALGNLNVILTPNPTIDTAIAATAWTHILAISDLEDDFIERVGIFIAGEETGFYLRFVLEQDPQVLDLESPRLEASEGEASEEQTASE